MFSKSLLLYKLHIDYSKIYPSFISIVLSLEKDILNVLLKCEGCTHFCEILYVFFYPIMCFICIIIIIIIII